MANIGDQPYPLPIGVPYFDSNGAPKYSNTQRCAGMQSYGGITQDPEFAPQIPMAWRAYRFMYLCAIWQAMIGNQVAAAPPQPVIVAGDFTVKVAQRSG